MLQKENKTGHRVFNFSAGPSTLPLPVLERAQSELLDYSGTGMSVMEISHRSAPFIQILEAVEAGIRKHLGVPEEYEVLFIQGGASLQFAMVPMNLYHPGKPVDVFHTGLWSQKAMQELEKIATMRIAGSSDATSFMQLPFSNEIALHPDASYVHLVSNNTVYGTQWQTFPDTGEIPLVADMSSDILSRQIDVKKFGVIFAGTQKNLGPSGLAIVVIRKDLAEAAPQNLPIMLQYRTYVEHKSLYNTPPTFTLYMVKLVLEWLESQGGLAAMEERNRKKAHALYAAIDENSFFECPVDKDSRSMMNVVFRISSRDEDLESRFAKEAESAGLSGLKGHRSAGGMRASIYNAFPPEGIQALISFMKDFSQKNG